jgi:hypothetical protein
MEGNWTLDMHVFCDVYDRVHSLGCQNQPKENEPTCALWCWTSHWSCSDHYHPRRHARYDKRHGKVEGVEG